MRIELQQEAVQVGDGYSKAPTLLPLVPAGRFVGRDGREYLNDKPERIIERFLNRRLPIVFDYEHGSELIAPGGREAPAAGWIEALEVRGAGVVYGRIDWTDKARNMLDAREYRFYSPAFEVDESQDPPRVLGLSSVGLTNHPNLFIPSLNKEQEQSAMIDKAIRQALSLKDEATADDVVVAINALKTDREVALNRAATPSLEHFVPRTDYAVQLNRAEKAESDLKSLRDEIRNGEIDAVIDKAIEDKKITPASVAYHRAQCATDGGLERFKEFVETTAPIVVDTDLDKQKPKATVQVNAEVAHVAKLLGKPIELFAEQAE